jgi:hypothetical protein
VLSSANAERSSWVELEQTCARKRGKPVFSNDLKRCDVSENSARSSFVRDQVTYALGLAGRVIPCVIDPRPRDVPVALREIQWVDLAGAYDTGLEQLRRALGS